MTITVAGNKKEYEDGLKLTELIAVSYTHLNTKHQHPCTAICSSSR